MTRSIAFAACAFSLFASAQHPTLPHTLAPWELERIPAYRDSRAGLQRGIQEPPAFPVRTMAEWEEIQTLVICWTDYPGVLKQIVRYAKDECEVLIVCDDPAAVTATLEDGSNGGPLPDLANITFMQAPFNSIWMRDYGAETIYRNEVDTLMLLDWIYNRPRPDDDVLPDAIAAHKGIPIYSTTQAPNDLVHTGGNFMCDGAGTAFSSNLVLDENGPDGQFNQTVKTEAQVEAIMTQWMGIAPGRYIKMETLPFDGIHHIDMHMKLLDEQTLLVGEFPEGESDGPQLELNVQAVLNTHANTFGSPYQLLRIPMPPSTGGAYPPNASYRTYANNVFVNRTVLVPTYRTEYDTTGLRILREALPGYRVVGIDCDDGQNNIIQASGAIHCITKAIGAKEPLLIRHEHLPDTYDTEDPYAVSAYIRHVSGIASAHLLWAVSPDGPFTDQPMTAQADDIWTSAIPAHPAGTTLYYYIQATANGGKVQVRPLVAPEGWWRFRVLDVHTAVTDPKGPVIAEVFPNPTSSLLVVALDHLRTERVRLSLVDATGREVRLLHDGAVNADGRLFLDIASLPPGAYGLLAETAHGRSMQRIVKH